MLVELTLYFVLIAGTGSPTIVYRVPADHELTSQECELAAQQEAASFVEKHGLEGRYGLASWTCGPPKSET